MWRFKVGLDFWGPLCTEHTCILVGYCFKQRYRTTSHAFSSCTRTAILNENRITDVSVIELVICMSIRSVLRSIHFSQLSYSLVVRRQRTIIQRHLSRRTVSLHTIQNTIYSMNRDGHETLKPETETRPRRWPHQPRRDRDDTFVGHETLPRR